MKSLSTTAPLGKINFTIHKMQDSTKRRFWCSMDVNDGLHNVVSPRKSNMGSHLTGGVVRLTPVLQGVTNLNVKFRMSNQQKILTTNRCFHIYPGLRMNMKLPTIQLTLLLGQASLYPNVSSISAGPNPD
jgi:hypothetical protein